MAQPWLRKSIVEFEFGTFKINSVAKFLIKFFVLHEFFRIFHRSGLLE